MSADEGQNLAFENEELKAQVEKLEQHNFELDKKLFELKIMYEIAKETTTTQDLALMFLMVFLLTRMDSLIGHPQARGPVAGLT